MNYSGHVFVKIPIQICSLSYDIFTCNENAHNKYTLLSSVGNAQQCTFVVYFLDELLTRNVLMQNRLG
jgi:hypothetical protein